MIMAGQSPNLMPSPSREALLRTRRTSRVRSGTPCRPRTGRNVGPQPRDCRRTPTAHPEGASMPLRMRVHDREPIGAALRRFKKLLERSGIKKELRKRKYYEKPCEVRRRAKLRKLSAIRKGKVLARTSSSH